MTYTYQPSACGGFSVYSPDRRIITVCETERDAKNACQILNEYRQRMIGEYINSLCPPVQTGAEPTHVVWPTRCAPPCQHRASQVERIERRQAVFNACFYLLMSAIGVATILWLFITGGF